MTGSAAPYNSVITYSSGYVGVGQGFTSSNTFLQTTSGGATGGTGSYVPQYHLDITGTERVNGARIFGDNSAQISATPALDYGTFGQNWTTVSGLSTSANWQTVAVSASGQYMTAGGNIGTIYYSSNYGQTWNSIAVTGNITSIVISSSGQYQIACAYGSNGIYYSTNFGASWTASNAPTGPQWFQVCMSTSGQFASACNAASTNITYYSTNYGITWTASATTATTGSFGGITCSASGQYQVAAIATGIIYYSSNYGQSWTASNISNAGVVQGASMSASGQYVMVITNGTLGNVWYSSNYGITFVSTAAGSASNNLRGSAASASGQYQLAAGYSGGMYYSLNYGVSWILGSAITSWFSSSMSANAQYCVACVSGGAVYMSMTREPPKILVNQSTTTTTGLTVLAPNIGASNNIGIILGRDLSSNNYATMGFQYVGASSTNNYLYLGMNATNTICIVNGQVGIGSTSIPQYCPLYVYSNLNSGWDGRGYFGNATLGFVCGTYNGTVLIGGHNSILTGWTNLTIGAVGTITSIPGSVGIGTTNPSTLLHVNGAVTIGTSLTFSTTNQINLDAGINWYVGGTQVGYFDSPASTWRISAATASILTLNAPTTMNLQTGGSNRMVLNSTGVGIGTASPSDLLHVYGSGVSGMRITTTNSLDMMLMYGNIGGALSTAVYVMPIRIGSTLSFRGGIYWDGTNLNYVNASDYRLKENVVPMQHGLSRIMSLNPVTYNWIEQKTVGEGFIAHEVQSVIPMAVSGKKDALDKDGSILPQGLDYSKIVVHLVSGMQEQQQLIAALQTQVQQLQQRLG